MSYNPQKLEKKWQKYWQDNKVNFCDLAGNKKPKFYNLAMFYYPSGAKIHIGHGYNYTGSDVFGRFKRLNGFNVLEPMGADAFGLPAENYAIKTSVHPSKTTEDNINFGRQQLKELGLMFDWEKEINTSSPDYYKWTQWLFTVLYKAGLAYRQEAPVNWCPSCKTVLANEQVISGKCERCDTQVTQKNLKQWFFKITDYADRLLRDHKKLDWPEKTLLMQRNWIGRSEGATVQFSIFNFQFSIEVFTTRPDTLFGATFMVLSPEHELVQKLKSQIKNWKEVEKYIKASQKKTDIERTDVSKEKTGTELKAVSAINPVNNEKIPIFIADYVLSSYGTGAIMAVPGHDQRDWDFAKKFKLPIIEVIKGGDITKQAYEDIEQGVMVNSDQFNGLPVKKCIQEITNWLKKNNLGKKAVNYKLRDWLISRQRYWGAPIPIIDCEKCGEVLVQEKDLPVELPNLKDFKPTAEGESPLARSKEFTNVKCPKCSGPAKRSTETMDTFVCSSWYFLRFISPNLKTKPFDKSLVSKWLPVDQYCGGAEHATLHLLYARFITKVLRDQGHINFDEPFTKLNHQGMILAEDGSKMSKSKGNVVIPDDYIKKYGADVFRLYVLFLAPFEDGGAWSDKGIIGVKRFLDKVWSLQDKIQDTRHKDTCLAGRQANKSQISNSQIERLVHQTTKKVTEDIENFHFNTAISALMILVNEFTRQKQLLITNYQSLITLLSPFAPHLAEELWETLGNKKSIFNQKWPAYDKKLIKEKEIQLVIQVNGKVRDKLQVSAGITEPVAKKKALQSEKVKKWVKGVPKKVIFVKGKLINIVI